MVCKILVIDDAPALHQLVSQHLGAHQFAVLSARDGESGLKAAIEHQPDVILLDVDMPGQSGYDVCGQLKANAFTRPIPILFLTASFTTDQKIRGLDLGATDYLTKPFEPAELRARVRAALRTKTAMDMLADNAMVDEMTGLFDRKYFDARLQAELAMSRRSGRSLGCILVNVDKMKSVNERFGQKAGDDLLRIIGQALQKMCRREDVIARFEDDRFAFLVADAHPGTLQDIAARVRMTVSATPLEHHERNIRVSASVGVALTHFSKGTSLVDETEAALSRARLAGGNCVRAGRELAELCIAT